MAEESTYKEWEQRIRAVEKLDDLPPEAKSIIEELKIVISSNPLLSREGVI